MNLNKGMLTAGILVLAGFLGGFSLSKGSGQILGIKPLHKAQSKAGNVDEVAAAGIFNAAEGDGGGGQHPRISQNGGGGGEGGDAPSGGNEGVGGGAGGGTGGATDAGGGAGGGSTDGRSGSDVPPTFKAAAGAGDGSNAQVTLSGAEAGDFLAGNTVDVGDPGKEPHLVYYALRGLRGDGNPRGFLVKRWTPKDSSSCEPGSDGALVCRPLQVRGQRGDYPAGAAIGSMLIAGNRWVPIYKGNTAGFPEHIPFIDSDVSQAEPWISHPQASAKGQAALTALLGHAASVVPPSASAHQPDHIVYLAANGQRLSMTRPEEDPDQLAGIAVEVGHWTFAKGSLCQSEGDTGPVPDCYQPELWDKSGLRLVSSAKAAVRLKLLAETPRRHAEAQN